MNNYKIYQCKLGFKYINQNRNPGKSSDNFSRVLADFLHLSLSPIDGGCEDEFSLTCKLPEKGPRDKTEIRVENILNVAYNVLKLAQNDINKYCY